MKILLYSSIILCSTFVLASPTASAQNSINSTTKNTFKENKTSKFIAYSDFSSKELPDSDYSAVSKVISLKESGAVRSLYMGSEQYVFDNLGTLKTFFAVADIHFDLDQSALRSDAIPVLDKLVYMMMEHPEISLATTSYSDTRYAKYNEKLALSRAQAANNYLESKGISKDRLSIEKHGRPQVANPCNDDPSCSLATQQLNRKTEFNVVYNGVNLGQVN